MILGLSETSIFASRAVRWVGSSLVSGAAGSGMGFVFAKLARAEVAQAYWAIGLGGTAGVLAALVALGIHERIHIQSVAARQAHSPPPHLKLGAHRGEHKS